MNSTRVTIVLLAIAAVLAAAVPTIRGGIDYFLVRGMLAHPDKLPAPEQVDRIVQEHPEDARLALGRAEYFQGLRDAAAVDTDDPYWGAWSSFWLRRARSLPTSSPMEQDTAEAYSLAIERAGDDPIARARYALWVLLSVGGINFPEEPSAPLPSLSITENGQMQETREALARWRRVDPQNGTPTAMIAWSLIAQGEMDEALDELRHLERADYWDDYEGEALLGAMAVLTEASHTPRTTTLFISYPACYAKARHLGRFLANHAHEARRAGHYWIAVPHYVAALRLAMLLAESPRPLDFLSAGAVFGLASKEDDPGGPGRPTPEQIAQRRLQAMQGLTLYLRAHGAPSVAEEAMEVFTRYQERLERYLEKSDAFHQWEWEAWGSPPVTNARIIWWTLSTLTLIAALAGLLALFLRPQGDHRPLQWRWWDWLGLAAVLVIPMQVWFGLLAEPIGPPEVQSPESTEEWLETWSEHRRQPIIPPRLRRAMDQWVPPALIAVGAWVLLAAAADVDRRRQAGDEDVPVGRVLHDLMRLTAPTLALLALLSVLAVPPARGRLQRISDEQLERHVQGDVAYYGIIDGHHADEGDVR